MYRRLDAVSVWLEQAGLQHLSSTNRMLRQIAGTQDLGPLATLGKIASPEGVGTREELTRKATPSTQRDPLVKPVDAVVPDPPYRRQFAAQVDELLNDAPKFAASSGQLTETFTAWREMGPAFAALAANAPVLNDVGGRVSQLQKLGSTGLEALQYLQSGKSASSNWKDAQLALIKQAQTPDVSLLKLPWLNSYRVLILAAADAGSLQNTGRQQWKQKVLDEAARNAPKEKYTW
jgi:hypothetical protein